MIDNTKIDIPAGMIDLELDNLQEEMDRNFSYQGFSLDKYLQMLGKTVAQFRTESRDHAIDTIKTRLILEAICKEEKIKVTKKEIDEKVSELAKAYGRKEEELKDNESFMNSIEESLKSEKAMKTIVDNANIKTVSKENKEEAKEEKKDTAKKTTKKTTTKKTTKK